MSALSLSQLESHLGKAAWLLKGPVDAADFKTYIFPLLFFTLAEPKLVEGDRLQRFDVVLANPPYSIKQ